MNYFKELNADYQVTDVVENIDIARILRENMDSGCEYVSIITETEYVIFFAKDFSKRMDKIGIIGLSDVEDKTDYGFLSVDDNGMDVQQHGVQTSCPGYVIRSIGYIKYFSGRIDNFEVSRTIVENLENIEYSIEAHEAKKLANKVTIKVMAG